jgi:hypothetical protein
MKKYLTIIFLLLPTLMFGQTETLKSLAEKFNVPTDEYRPHTLWHWMGVNISKEGMTRDLEAMKESGIGGVYIFNISGIDNPEWKDRTWRSDYYWEALRHAMAEAKRLGLETGIHNTPGYTATGGPWISQEQGMQKVVFYKKQIQGGKLFEDTLSQPAPVINGARKSSFYRDIAVYAVPVKKDVSVSETVDISSNMDAEGRIKWQAPEGDWQLVRIGHAPTMKLPVPLPRELWGSLEVDKMSRKHNVYHWQQVLNPLIEHLKEYIGNTFTFVALDSYEAGEQDWTETFRSDFRRLKGYDPVPWIALRYTVGNAEEREDLKVFEQDNRDVISRLMIDNGWKTAAEMVHAAGLKFYWEPYGGPFDTNESAGIPDMPMVEYWTGGKPYVDDRMLKSIKEMVAHDQRIIAAEAFTGRPDSSRYTEDPAFLKHCADLMYASGVNQTYLHHWVHQPFDDRYRPGMDFYAWGTHFGRHQTWFRPGKAFFTYLSRCQMLLQQGFCVEITSEWAHRRIPEAEIFFVRNPENTVIERSFSFPVKNRVPELWDAYHGTIRQTGKWNAAGDSIFVKLTLQPEASVFVVFPYNKEENYSRLPEIEIIDSKTEEITGAWDVTFQPAAESPFKRKLQSLIDFSKQNDKALKYFSGTAVYRKNIRVSAGDIKEGHRVMLELGEMYDIAELTVNGKPVGVLWNPPYDADITPFLKSGNNTFEIAVTNNWANRLIGDEQEPPDFKVGDLQNYRGSDVGRPMTAYPDWFLNNLPRPSQGRKTFNIHHYYNAESPLFPAGLVGPVRIVKQKIKTL